MFLIGNAGVITGGDPSVPTPPTTIPPAWLQMLQAELGAILVAAGMNPDPGNSAQVAAAIQQLISTSSFALASDAEAIAGTIINKAVTPHSAAALVTARINAVIANAPGALDTLKELADAIGDDANFAGTVTAALSARAMAARKITTAGLLTGGGDLTGDRAFNVIAATFAEYIAGTAADRALTPASLAGAGGTNANGSWSYLPGGFLMQWGQVTVPASGGSAASTTIVFPTQFQAACQSINGNADDGTNANWRPQSVTFPGGPSLNSCIVQIDSTDPSHINGSARTVWWTAKGK